MSKILVDKVVLEQALEALEQSETFVSYEGFGMARREAERKHQAAITALRAALAEPAQEPDDGGCDGSRGALCIHQDPNECKPERDCPAFSAPPQQRPTEPVQEPVAWMSKADIEHPSGWRTVFLHTSAMPTENSVPLFTAPPQRKPLMEEEPVFEVGFGWLDDATKYPKGTKLYIAPLQRKPLTEEEIRQIAIDTPNTPKAFARAIERAHEIGE